MTGKRLVPVHSDGIGHIINDVLGDLGTTFEPFQHGISIGTRGPALPLSGPVGGWCPTALMQPITCVVSDESHVTQVNYESVVESWAMRAAPGKQSRNESDNGLFTDARGARA